MSAPPFATMPLFTTNNTTAVFGFDSGNFDTVGGTAAIVSAGRPIIASNAMIQPMLWHRGSAFNLGLFGINAALPGSLPPAGAQDYFPPNGNNAIYWDSPKSWGRQNFLIRRPRTLIITDNIGLYLELEAWVNANYSSFAALNVSVIVGTDYWFYSWLASGIPFTSTATTTVNTDTMGSDQLTYSTAVATPSQFLGGDCFVARLMPDIMGMLQVGDPGGYCSAVGTAAPDSLATPSGFTLYQTTAVNLEPPPVDQLIGVLVNTGKAQNDGAILQAGAARFNTFQLIAYQYNNNPTTSAYFLSNSGLGDITTPFGADPFMPSSVADTLIGFGGSVASRKTFTTGDSTDLLAQLLTDVLAFFPALP